MKFKYSLDNKRYHTLNYYYQNKFNSKIFKVSLDANFTCPNIDGKVGHEGCIYCTNKSNNYDNLITQFNTNKNIILKKWPNSKYITYFQNNTNTYAPLAILKQKYESVLHLEDVIGISIATRSDSIRDDVLNYLEELNNKTFLTIELGLQTIHEKTLQFINRGHTLDNFVNMVNKLREKKINVVVHIINGLPYETKEMMIDTVKYLSNLDIQGIKIHMLHILKNTKLEIIYKQKPFHILNISEYVDIVCDQLENIKDTIVIHRITGDPIKEDLIAPSWLIKKFKVLNEIDKELERRNTYQGFNKSILNKAHQIMEDNLKEKDYVIDATLGNGNDILFLCKICVKGHVYGFDIQNIALEKTKTLLEKNKIANYTLINKSHEYMLESLNNLIDKISLVIFNLGYLPNGNKKITTNYKSSIKGIGQALKLLKRLGIILIVIYPGCKEGLKEDIKINEYLKTLNSYKITKYTNTDNKKAPYLIEIKRIL